MKNGTKSKDPYKVLGVSRFSSYEEAKSRYRELCKKYHPDNISGDALAFKQVVDAWESLKALGPSAFGMKRCYWSHESIFKVKRREM